MISKLVTYTFFILLSMLYIGYTYYDYTISIAFLIGTILAIVYIFYMSYYLIKPESDIKNASNGAIAGATFLKALLLLVGLAYLMFIYLLYIPELSATLGLMMAYSVMIINFIGLVGTAYERQINQKNKLNGGSPSFGR